MKNRCAACQIGISDLESYVCLGHCCEKVLCYDCKREFIGLCPRCFVLDDIDRVGPTEAENLGLYDELPKQDWEVED